MFLWNLMSSDPTGQGDWMTWVFLGVAVLMIGAMFFFSSRNQKKRQQEMQATLSALKPGCKVKTIGGICGIVVEVCPEDNTFVLETGTEKSGKCCIKFDKQAVYQTDAVVKKEEPKAEVKEDVKEEVKEEVAEEAVAAPETEEKAE